MHSTRLDECLTRILGDYGERETEHNWERVEGGFKRAAEACGTCSPDAVIAGIKRIRDVLTSSLLTERTRLSSAAMEFVKAACKAGGPQMADAMEILLPPLLKLGERTNKVFVQRSQQTMTELIKAAPSLKTVLPKFLEAMKSPNKGLRGVVAEAFETLLTCSAGALDEWAEQIEKFVLDGLSDASPQVRETSRKIYFSLKRRLGCETMCKKIFEKSTGATQKMLDGSKPAAAPIAGGLKRTTSVAKTMSNAPVVSSHPARVVKPVPAPSTGNIGGAQRVLKPVDSPALTPGAKAARVAVSSVHGTPIKSVGLKSSKSVSDTGAGLPQRPMSSLASCVSAGQLPESSTSAATVRHEIVQNITGCRSGDWAARVKGFEALTELLTGPESLIHIEGSRAASQRLFDALIHGLSDTHFKVLEAVVQFGVALLACFPLEMLPEPTLLDGMLAKIVYLSVNPQYKGKSCQEAASGPLLEGLRAWLGDIWRFLTSLAAAYTKPEVTSSVKARAFIMTRVITELEALPFESVSETELIFHLKTITGRVSTAILDHDLGLQQLSVSLFQLLFEKFTPTGKAVEHLQMLIQSLKLSSARTALLEKLKIQVKPDVQEEETTAVAVDMEIEAEGDPEPVFITLDEELGIQMRVRPQTFPTPPIDELAQTLSSVLQSPFPNDDEDKEVIEMNTIDDQIGEEIVKFVNIDELENPFLVNTA